MTNFFQTLQGDRRFWFHALFLPLHLFICMFVYLFITEAYVCSDLWVNTWSTIKTRTWTWKSHSNYLMKSKIILPIWIWIDLWQNLILLWCNRIRYFQPIILQPGNWSPDSEFLAVAHFHPNRSLVQNKAQTWMWKRLCWMLI